MVSHEIGVDNHMPLSYLKEVIKSQKKGAIIDFFGGEPTIHPDFLKAVKYARDLGFDVTVASNGRMLSYDKIASKIKELGVMEMRISVYGHDAETHDLVTDTSRIRSELEYQESVPMNIALKQTIAWERANPPDNFDPKRFDYALEDKILDSL